SRYAAMSEDCRMAMSIAADSGTERVQGVSNRRNPTTAQAPRERPARTSLFIWLIWFIWFFWSTRLIWFVSFIWFIWLGLLNQLNQTNQTNETNQINQPVLALHALQSVARTVPNTCNAFPS